MRKLTLSILPFLLIQSIQGGVLELDNSFVSIDYISGSKSAYEDFKNSFNDIFGFSTQTGNSSSVSPISAGVKLGTFIKTRNENSQLGASIGYIRGPQAEFTITDASLGTAKTDIHSRFLRFMMESRHEFPFSEKSRFRINAGLGFSHGKIEQAFDDYGYSHQISNSWTGITWEVGPSFVMRGQKYGLEISGYYMALPAKGKSVEFIPINYYPYYYEYAVPAFRSSGMGIRVSLEFLPQEDDGWGY